MRLRLIWPVIVVVCVAGLSLRAIQHRRTPVQPDVEDALLAELEERNQIDLPEGTLYVQGVKGHKLLSPILKRKVDDPDLPVVIMAREGALRWSDDRAILVIALLHGEGRTNEGSTIQFDERFFEFQLPGLQQKLSSICNR
jgi:hypothetical protein